MDDLLANTFGTNSRCFESTVKHFDLTATDNNLNARCHEFKCLKGVLAIVINGEVYKCTANGCTIII